MLHVYQTWKTHQLPYDFQQLHNSWNTNTFNVSLHDDNEILKEIYTYCSTHSSTFCAKLKLFSTIQLVDLWRYIKIYTNGGLYVDVDIGVHEAQRIHNLCKSYDLVVFRESPTPLHEPFKFVIHAFKYITGLNDHARLFQFRQSVFCAKQHHPFLDVLLFRISHQSHENQYVEPRLTYELTGPGIFSDTLASFLDESTTAVIQYNDGLRIIDYHHAGTWKTSFEHVEYILRNKNLIISLSITINLLLIFFIMCYRKMCSFWSKI